MELDYQPDWALQRPLQKSVRTNKGFARILAAPPSQRSHSPGLSACRACRWCSRIAGAKAGTQANMQACATSQKVGRGWNCSLLADAHPAKYLVLDYVSVCPSLYASNITQKGRTPCRLAQSSATGNACLHLRLRSQGPKNDTQAVVAAVLADKLVCHRKRGGCSFRLHSRAYACKGTLTILKPYWETLQPCCTTFSEPCRNLEACAISLSYGFEMGRAGHDCASVPEEQVPRRAVSRQLAGVFLSQNQASHPMSPNIPKSS